MKNLFLSIFFFVSAITLGNNSYIDSCLKSWGKHPFDQKNYNYRTIQANVKVLGIGGNVSDTNATTKPELILVNHSVSVLSKQVFEFLNPNGWYCIRGSTSVLAKSKIRIHCKAHLATTIEGAAVMGGAEHGTGGVTVLGNAVIEKIGCEEKPEPAVETPTPTAITNP